MSDSQQLACRPGAEPIEAQIQRLQCAGMAAANPVAWHHIERLAERTRHQQGAVKILLEARLHRALTELTARAQARANDDLAPKDGLGAKAPRTGRSALGLLLTDIAQFRQNHGPSEWSGTPPTESPQARMLRQELRRIGVQKQLSQALDRAPQNAGPLNSHRLVLSALGLLAEISPDYLSHFMVHLNTLLCLHVQQDRMPRTSLRAARSGKSARS